MYSLLVYREEQLPFNLLKKYLADRKTFQLYFFLISFLSLAVRILALTMLGP